jgi:hypothetical protein
MIEFIGRLLGSRKCERGIAFPSPPGVREALAPRTVRDLLPISIWCDAASCALIRAAYETRFAGRGAERVTHLNSVAQKVGARHWEDVFPYIPSTFWCISWRSLTQDEAASLPIVVLSFLYQSDLGMLATDTEDVVLLGIEPTRRCGILPPFAPIGGHIDLNLAESQMRNSGWKCDVMRSAA